MVSNGYLISPRNQSILPSPWHLTAIFCQSLNIELTFSAVAQDIRLDTPGIIALTVQHQE